MPTAEINCQKILFKIERKFLVFSPNVSVHLKFLPRFLSVYKKEKRGKNLGGAKEKNLNNLPYFRAFL